MSKDIKIFNGCDHVIDNVMYEYNTCPRCYGYDFYYDIALDLNGRVITCEKDTKLQQEVLKIMNDEKRGNLFHLDWGNLLITSTIVGTKNLSITEQKIKMLVYETLQYLKNVQINNQILFNNMTEEEILEEITDIQVLSLGPMGYQINVTFKNVAGDIFRQEIII